MDLDKYDEFGKIDHTGVIRNIDEFGFQLETAFEEINKFVFPSNFFQAKSIVLLGVNESLIANILIQTLARMSRIPMIVWSGEGIPHFIDSSTLVIGCSYTGEDERVINSFNLAAKKGAKLFAFSTGGMLASLSRKYKNSYFEISYGASPDTTIGYNIAILYSLITRFEYIDNSIDEYRNALKELNAFQKHCNPESSKANNPAKQLAIRLNLKHINLYYYNEQESVALRFNQQLENMSKYFSSLYNLSHQQLLEDRQLNEIKLKDRFYNIIIESNFHSSRQISRIGALYDTLKKRGRFNEKVIIEEPCNFLSELIKYISLADYTAYYIAMQNNTLPENTGKIL